jgi:hypothetical protein
MHLTEQQETALKNAIQADATANAFPNTADGNEALAAYMNMAASPAFIVWRTAVDVNVIMKQGFDWTEVDGLTVAKARIWEWMSRLGTIDASSANIRAALQQVFGSGTVTFNQTLPLMKREATRFEKVFTTGTGTTNAPGTIVVEGPVDGQHISDARSS